MKDHHIRTLSRHLEAIIEETTQAIEELQDGHGIDDRIDSMGSRVISLINKNNEFKAQL